MAFKIYTKTGDTGTTGLYGGQRVHKDDIRIEAYGTVDELNSFIGGLRASLSAMSVATSESENAAKLLQEVQSQLFTIGSQLATPKTDSSGPEATASPAVAPTDEADVASLERGIDELDALLPQLASFILPAGSAATSAAHVCRTVTRRAERRVVTLARDQHVDSDVVRYLNRLSDYFFTLARATAFWAGEEDVAWQAKAS